MKRSGKIPISVPDYIFILNLILKQKILSSGSKTFEIVCSQVPLSVFVNVLCLM